MLRHWGSTVQKEWSSVLVRSQLEGRSWLILVKDQRLCIALQMYYIYTRLRKLSLGHGR